MTEWLVADGHVHFHPRYSLGEFLDAAWENLTQAGRGLQLSGPHLPYLLLAETEGTDAFGDWVSLCDRGGPAGWSFRSTEEVTTLLASKSPESGPLAIVAGRQISTREGLEVLALGTRERHPPSMPFTEALAWAEKAAAISVIPWGFGKWTGSRGMRVGSAVADPKWGHVFLGDNGNRCEALCKPPTLPGKAGDRAQVLPGSDPLPLPGQNGRAGSAGFAVQGRIELMNPLAALVAALSEPGEPQGFIRTAGIPSFVLNQALMITRKTFLTLRNS